MDYGFLLCSVLSVFDHFRRKEEQSQKDRSARKERNGRTKPLEQSSIK